MIWRSKMSLYEIVTKDDVEKRGLKFILKTDESELWGKDDLRVVMLPLGEKYQILYIYCVEKKYI